MTPAPLPPDLESLLARAVKRARLRRSEREDVARELRSHFQSALDDGRSIDDIARAFGDPRAAGRLIGRAKRRCRSPLWHAWVWSCRGMGALLALLLVTYGWAAWAYYGAEPTITRNYMKEMNERIAAIPEEDRAWPLYREALLLFPHDNMEHALRNADDLEAGPEWNALVDLVSRNQVSIELILRGSARASLGAHVSGDGDQELQTWWGIDPAKSASTLKDPANPPHWALDWRPSVALKILGNLLRADAWVAAINGDGDRWSRDVVAGLRMAGHAGRTPQIMNYLIALSINPMFMNRISRDIALRPEFISEDDLVLIVRELRASLEWKREIPFADQKRAVQDGIQRLYNAASGRITAQGVESLTAYYRSMIPIPEESKKILEPSTIRGPVNALIMPSRDEALARVDWMFESWAHRARTPLLERGPDEVRAWMEKEPWLSIYKDRWWPVLAGAAIGFGTEKYMDWMVMETEALDVAIAIELFTRHEKRLPSTLEELVPDYLPAVPIDIFSGESLQYTISDGIPIIYSVGCDMDDDGGRQPSEEFGTAAISAAANGPPRATEPEWWTEERIREYDGDWTLWPWFNRETDVFEYTPRTK